MSKKYYLIDWTMCWVDELDIISYEVMTEEEHIEALKLIDQCDLNKNIKFGLGSDKESDELTVQEIRELVVGKEITEIEYNSFISMFDGKTIGDTNFEDSVKWQL